MTRRTRWSTTLPTPVRATGDPVMVPSFRPDRALAIDDCDLEGLHGAPGRRANVSIESYQLPGADQRHAAFHELGAGPPTTAWSHRLPPSPPPTVQTIFDKMLPRQATHGRKPLFKTGRTAGSGTHERRVAGPCNCTWQPSATSTPPCSTRLGPDTGYDAVNDEQIAAGWVPS
jgi:glucuronate isomerase